MRYLIDGYNLLYALGLARRNGGKAAWDRGRRQLLDWLADQHGKSAGDVTVIFDAQNSLGGFVEETHRGLHVIRDRGRTADDLIEDMLREEKSPDTLTVVSDDARVRSAATRRKCVVRHCDEYVELLMDPPKTKTNDKPVEDEKPDQITPADKAKWMKTFGE